MAYIYPLGRMVDAAPALAQTYPNKTLAPCAWGSPSDIPARAFGTHLMDTRDCGSRHGARPSSAQHD